MQRQGSNPWIELSSATVGRWESVAGFAVRAWIEFISVQTKGTRRVEIQRWDYVMRTRLAYARWTLLRKSGIWSGKYFLGLCQERP